MTVAGSAGVFVPGVVVLSGGEGVAVAGRAGVFVPGVAVLSGGDGVTVADSAGVFVSIGTTGTLVGLFVVVTAGVIVGAVVGLAMGSPNKVRQESNLRQWNCISHELPPKMLLFSSSSTTPKQHL